MITLKTEKEIEVMAAGGRILAKIIRQLRDSVGPGITTETLDKLARELIFSSGAKPAFLNYGGFPAALCVSVNEQIVHGVPSARILLEGDVVGLDLGILYQGFYSDMAVTVPVGSVDPEANRLIRATKKALARAIARVKPGKTLGDVSQAIQKHIEDQRFSIIKELCGHGVGRKLHEDPEVLNFGQRHKGAEIKVGMVLAIEPMACLGKPGIQKGADKFSYQTIDGSVAAHFEHTIAVTKKRTRVLTE